MLTIANTETLSSESLGWKFLPRDDSPPENGVPCDLEREGGQACYLGMAVYSDGICVEVMILHCILPVVILLNISVVHHTVKHCYHGLR